MEKENKPDIYELDELIERLKKIYTKENEKLNFPKAFYSLALEIKKLKEKINEKSGIL